MNRTDLRSLTSQIYSKMNRFSVDISGFTNNTFVTKRQIVNEFYTNALNMYNQSTYQRIDHESDSTKHMVALLQVLT